MTRRPALALAPLTAFSLVFAACAGAASPAPSQVASQPAATAGSSPADASPQESVTASASPAGSTGTTGSADEACAAAQEAGATVNVWAQDAEITQQTHALFREAYPGIETTELDIRPEDIAQRLLSEAAAGRAPEVDVIIGNLPPFVPLADEALIDQESDWASLGVPDNLISPSNLVRTSRIPNGLVYNTNTVSEDELPTTWEEFIDPKWQGRVVEDPRGRPFETMALEWGEEQTLDYINRLVETVQPELIEGTTAGILAVASGELDITINARSAEKDEQVAKGAPVDIRYLDVIPTTDYYAGVVTGAPNPEAARCYVAWRVGEGADDIYQLNFQPNDDVPENAPEGATIVTIDTAEDVAFAAQMADKVSAAFTGQ